MNNLTVTVIVPRLPPAIDGLGDYALRLAIQMRSDYGLNTKFIVGDPSWNGANNIEGFEVKKVSTRSKEALLYLIQSETLILLHYVGYGYAKRGSPVWLIRALGEWKLGRQTQLLTMFHECYAFGPIWTSQFWTSPLQRILFSRLSILSDQCLTSKYEYANNISRHSSFKLDEIIVIPVFSNIGELEKLIPLSKRDRSIVVFGGTIWRKYVYENCMEQLKSAINAFKIEKIIDIGKPIDVAIKFDEVKFESKGILPPEEISQIFSHSMIGFFFYPQAYLSKSGIFASYCSHGLLPVGSWFEEQKSDGVLEGKHFLKAEKINPEIELSEAQKISNNSFEWYQEHNLKIHSFKYYNLLQLAYEKTK